MGYRLIAETAMTLHFVFVTFLVVGGFLAWRWRWMLRWHIAAMVWVSLVIGAHVPCPLTALEDWGRKRAGERGIPEGFVDHYLTGVLYPAHDIWWSRAFVVVMVVVSWIGLRYRAGRPGMDSHGRPTQGLT
jgi:hypothetical protein